MKNNYFKNYPHVNKEVFFFILNNINIDDFIDNNIEINNVGDIAKTILNTFKKEYCKNENDFNAKTFNYYLAGLPRFFNAGSIFLGVDSKKLLHELTGYKMEWINRINNPELYICELIFKTLNHMTYGYPAGEKILMLRKMGLNFDLSPEYHNYSDTMVINNHRVRTLGYNVRSKNGRDCFVEFTISTRYNYRTINKRTGEPLKGPAVRETILVNALNVDVAYYNQYGECFGDSTFIENIWNKHLEYTPENILKVVNELSIDNYIHVYFID